MVHYDFYTKNMHINDVIPTRQLIPSFVKYNFLIFSLCLKFIFRYISLKSSHMVDLFKIPSTTSYITPSKSIIARSPHGLTSDYHILVVGWRPQSKSRPSVRGNIILQSQTMIFAGAKCTRIYSLSLGLVVSLALTLDVVPIDESPMLCSVASNTHHTKGNSANRA
jgi:hypothetical protein